MTLFQHEGLVHSARNYRVVFLGGRYGGGKTALAFRLAYELMQNRSFGFRYLLSNVRSVWNTPPSAVELRDGVFADAVMVLDEGGMFLDSPRRAKEWLAYLRKLNIVLLIPSVIEPALIMRRLSIQRLQNFQPYGLPLWRFGWRLDSHMVKQKNAFLWWNFAEIFGIYDTMGMPADADALLGEIEKWVEKSSKALGYKAKLPTRQNVAFSPLAPASFDDDLIEAQTESAHYMGEQIDELAEKISEIRKRK